MYKNILCAVDVSSENKLVLDKAQSLAEKYEAHLSLIHVIEYSLLPKDYQKKLKDDIGPKIDKLAERYGIPKKRRFVKVGQPNFTICQQAEKSHIDLIVIGSHGKHGVKALLGSTCNGVLHSSDCDVHLVKIAK